jgi:hypothetical protein
MLIPSTRLMEHMKRTSSGFFFEAVNQDTKIVLAAKIPHEIVRYIGLNAPVYMSFRTASIGQTQLLCSTFAVEDDPEAMFFLYRTHHYDEIALIRRFLQQDEAEIYAFDELNRNIASFVGQLEFDTENVDRILEGVAGIREGSSPPESPEFGRTVRRFMEKLERELPFDVAAMRAIRFVATSKNLPIRRTILAPTDAPASQPARFSQWEYPLADNEGDQFETRLARLFGQVFSDGSIVAAPSISVSSKEREFIDLVLVGSTGICLIEAKASSVTEAAMRRSTERRVWNIEKDLKKAARQLRGAHRRLVESRTLDLRTATQSRKIIVTEEALRGIHLMIILSEIHPDLSSKTIVRDLMTLGHQLSCGVHVVDMQGLQTLLRLSHSSSEFFHYLDVRWDACKQRGDPAFVFLTER